MAAVAVILKQGQRRTRSYAPLILPGQSQESINLQGVHGDAFVGVEDTRVASLDEVEAARAKIAELERIHREQSVKLQDLDALWSTRRQPLEYESQEASRAVEDARTALESIRRQPVIHKIRPLGPAWLSFVETTWFAACCHSIVALNMLAMAIGPRYPEFEMLFSLFDNIFLVWYIFELYFKIAYFQRNLFFGELALVFWNWQDLVIVASGILDQWLVPAVALVSGQSMDHLSWLRFVRVFRVFRTLRILKLVRAVLQSDMKWTKSMNFELFMSVVIAVNALTMSLELDIEWAGWVLVQNSFLVIYTFEVYARMKLARARYFTGAENCAWNYLDFLIVAMGMFDLWLMPIFRFAQGLLQGPHAGSKHSQLPHMHDITSMMRMLRLFRILRLVKLVKHIKPLYRLTLGILETMKAIQWVMILTMLMLYAGAILWTQLVGHGIIDMDEDSPSREAFGTVPESLFSLFRLMNGDADFASDLYTSVAGQVLFCGFMVLANWGVLAILTSVVSDNMLESSRKMMESEQLEKREKALHAQRQQLQSIFERIDDDKSGSVSRLEWEALLGDSELLQELIEASGLDEQDLRDMWSCLSTDSALEDEVEEGDSDDPSSVEQVMYFEEFINCSTQSAEKRQFMLMRMRLETLENKMAMMARRARKSGSMCVGKSITQFP